MKQWSSLVLPIIICFCLLVLLSTPVAAHAYLSESDPANGEQLESVPNEMSLYFSGDGVVIADIEITDPDGNDVVSDIEIDPDDTQIVRAALDGDDSDGLYIVEWEVLADDGHTTSGTFFFSVGAEPIDRDAVLAALDDGEDESIPPLETTAKGLVLLTLVGLIGIPATIGFALTPAARSANIRSHQIDHRAVPLLGIIVFLLGIGLFLLGISRIGGLEADRFSDFLSQPLGQIWLVQLLITIGLVAVLFLALRKRISQRTWTSILIGGGLIIAAGIGWNSHSATLIGRIEGFAVTITHIAGAGLWVGGLLTLAIILPPVLSELSQRNQASFAAETIRRFSVLALAGVTLALVSGFVLAAWHVPSVDTLLASVYGAALSVKSIAILLALGLGGMTRYVLLSDLEPWRTGILDRFQIRNRLPAWKSDRSVLSRVKRAVRVEVTVLVVIILLAGVLTSVPTAAIVADGDEFGEVTFEESAEEFDIDITLFPAEEIASWPQTDEDQPFVIDVRYHNADGEIASDGPVRVLAEHSASGVTIEIELDRDEETGVYSGVQVLPDPGHWDLRITGSPDGTFTSNWIEIFAAPSGEDHDHGGDEPLTAGLSLALLVSAVLVGVVGVFATTIEALRLRT